jgi:hypothetical protein
MPYKGAHFLVFLDSAECLGDFGIGGQGCIGSPGL